MSENKTPVLEVIDLGIDFGGLTAVNDFNFEIPDGKPQPQRCCA